METQMMQLYARVFVQILDSSIAEDYMLRHVFEDFFKLVDHRTGIVDMTRTALARRLNIPIEVLNEQITKLESPDPHSRDEDFEGRRIERLDKHRDWGWKILNWEKYDVIRKKADLYTRVSKHREKEAESSGKFQKPTIEEVKLEFSQKQMPMAEAEGFFNYYESNGWRVGKNPMKSWTAAAANWKRNWLEKHPEKSAGQIPSHWPSKSDVATYAKEKGDDRGYYVSWYAFWQKKDFKRDGKILDWKVEFSKSFANKRV